MTKKKKIRVLEIIRQGEFGGGETHVLQIIQNIESNHYELTILAFSNGPMVEYSRRLGVDVIVLPVKYPFQLNRWLKIIGIAREKQIDLIHAHGTKAASNSFFLKLFKNIPVIYTIHGWSFHKDQSLFIFIISVLSEFLITFFVSQNINVSESNRNTGKKLLPGFKSVVIPNGIEIDKFKTNNLPDDLLKIRSKKDEVIIGFIARLTKQKSPILLLEVFNELSNRYSIQLLMVGDGELMGQCMEKVNRYKNKDKIHFLGYRKDIAEILNLIDIYCLPSLWEGHPIGLMEAMASGKAVIATNVDGSRDIIENEENGLIIPMNDPNALKNSLEMLIVNKALRDKLSLNAKCSIERDFKIEQCLAGIEDLYEKITSEK